MNRRGFLTGMAAAIAAPAVVRSGVLMPLRGIVMPTNHLVGMPLSIVEKMVHANMGGYMYTDEIAESILAQIGPLCRYRGLRELLDDAG